MQEIDCRVFLGSLATGAGAARGHAKPHPAATAKVRREGSPTEFPKL